MPDAVKRLLERSGGARAPLKIHAQGIKRVHQDGSQIIMKYFTDIKGLIIAQAFFECTEGGIVEEKSISVKLEDCQLPEPLLCENGENCPTWECSEKGDDLFCEARCFESHALARKQKCSCYTRMGPLKFFTGCKWEIDENQKSCAADSPATTAPTTTTSIKSSTTTTTKAKPENNETFSSCHTLANSKSWKCDLVRKHRAKCRLPCRGEKTILNKCFCIQGVCKWTHPVETKCKATRQKVEETTSLATMLLDAHKIEQTEESEEPEEKEQEPKESRFRSQSRIQIISTEAPQLYRGMRYVIKDGRRMFNQNDLISQFLNWFRRN